MSSTTLITFLLECSRSVRTVELLGSWDNFSSAYDMKRDTRKGMAHWTGCYRFKDIICDGDLHHLSERRDGGLMMGGLYWYYYRLDGDLEYCDPSNPSTTSCPLMPGQRLNILEVPKESDDDDDLFNFPAPTLNPEDKFQTPRPPKRLEPPVQSTLAPNSYRLLPPRLFSHDRSTPRSARAHLPTQLYTIPERRAKSVTNSPIATPEPMVLCTKGNNSEVQQERGRARSRLDSRNRTPARERTGDLDEMKVHRRESSHLQSLRSPITADYSSDQSVTSESHSPTTSQATSMDVDPIAEFIESDSPLRSSYSRLVEAEQKALTYEGLEETLRPLYQRQSATETCQRQCSPEISLRRSDSKIESSVPPRQDDLIQEKSFTTLSDIKEAEMEASPPSLQLTELYLPKHDSASEVARPPSRRDSPHKSPPGPSVLDLELPALPLLPEGLALDSLDFHLGMLDDREQFTDMHGHETQPSWNITSLELNSALSDDGAMTSPTFSTNTESSSGIPTPNRHMDALDDSMEGYFADELDDMDDQDVHFNQAWNRENHSYNETSPHPESVKHTPFLGYQHTFSGYSLPEYHGASEVTLTQFNLGKHESRPTSTHSGLSATQSRAPGEHHVALSEMEQLVDDFAYLGEAVN